MSSLSEITINSYNKTAEEYYKIVSSFELLPELETFINMVKQDGRILDLGCGPGHHSKVFFEHGFQVDGIDLSPEMIKIAKKEVQGVRFNVMDILDIKFDEDSFDGIWASASLLHIPKEKILPTLKRLRLILKKEGIIYISLKEGDGAKIVKDKRYDGVDKFYSFFQFEEIKNLIEKAGFKLVQFNISGRRKSYDTNSWIHLFCTQNV